MPKRTPVIVTDYRPKILAGSTTASGGAQPLIVHDINTSHSGNLLWSRLDKAGSSLADIVTRPHGALTDIGTNTHAQIDSHIATGDIHVAHSGVTLTAGNGLTGGGTIAASRTFAVGAGDGITVNADDVAVDTTVVRTTRTITSGGGLTGGGDLSANRTLAVGAGTLITVGADTVGITPGANFQFVGTGSGTAATWRNVSELAGNGLDSASGVLAVGVANTGATGLSVESNAVRLTSNSNPGAAASILASSASGSLQLVTLASNVGFTSGFAGAGYRVDYGVTEAGKASAEFDNLTVRGRMRIYELLIQQIRATNGSVFVSSSSRAEVVTEDNDWHVNGEQLDLNGVGASFDARIFTIRTRTTTGSGDRNLYHGFLVNDILRAQRVDIGTGGSLITRQVNLQMTRFVNLWEYVGALVSGDVPVVGDEMVRLGSITNTTRQGSIYLTSDDSNAPFIDIVNEVASHAEWNQAGKIKARLGRLSGIVDDDFDEPVSGYGLYSDNVYLKGQIVVTGGNAATTDALNTGLATKINTGGAAADVNDNTTTISGGRITTGTITASQIAANTITAAQIAASTITADRLNVTSLAAINANLGNVTAGQIIVGDLSNKLWLNDANDGGLAIGGTTKGSAQFKVTAAGALTATNATITGSVTSTSGAIGGWTLSAGALTSGNVGLRSGQVSTGVAIYAGNAIPGFAAFQVTAEGELKATDAIIEGFITATGGLFTGVLAIGTNGEIRQGTGTLGSNFTGLRVWASGGVGKIAGYNNNTIQWQADTDGRLYAGGTAVKLDATGITATAGQIGGWTLGATSLTAGSGSSSVGVSTGSVAFYAGNATAGSAPFRVTNAGALTSTSGAIGGWTIGNATISSSTLTIDSSGPSIRSGKGSYDSTTAGFWIGLDSGTPKFHFGGTVSGVERYIRWTGTTLEINQATIATPSLSTTWSEPAYNNTGSGSAQAKWRTFPTFGMRLRYARMGQFVFVHGWVENELSRTLNGNVEVISKDFPAPDGTQFIHVRSSVADSETTGGYGNVVEIADNSGVGWLTLLVNAGPGSIAQQNLIINGWYKAAA